MRATEGIGHIGKSCFDKGCSKSTSFVVEGGKVSMCAYNYSSEVGAVDVISKRYGHEGCRKRSKVDMEGSTTWTLYCKDHAEDGIVDVTKRSCGHES